MGEREKHTDTHTCTPRVTSKNPQNHAISQQIANFGKWIFNISIVVYCFVLFCFVLSFESKRETQRETRSDEFVYRKSCFVRCITLNHTDCVCLRQQMLSNQRFFLILSQYFFNYTFNKYTFSHFKFIEHSRQRCCCCFCRRRRRRCHHFLLLLLLLLPLLF